MTTLVQLRSWEKKKIKDEKHLLYNLYISHNKVHFLELDTEILNLSNIPAHVCSKKSPYYLKKIPFI